MSHLKTNNNNNSNIAECEIKFDLLHGYICFKVSIKYSLNIYFVFILIR